MRAEPISRRRLLVTLLGMVLAVLTAVGLTCAMVGPSGRFHREPALWAPDLSGPDRLLGNEVAHHRPDTPGARRSPDWDVTSGSLFLRDGALWTGAADAATPDVRSRHGAGSSVFRAISRRHDFRDVTVSLWLRNLGMTRAGRFPPAPLDGVHLLLRWQDPADLYAVSLNRRDHQVVVKRKAPHGPVNGGRYITLGKVHYLAPHGSWQRFTVRITNGAHGVVAISVTVDGRRLLVATDDSTAAPAIVTSGAIGLRGDNCEFEVTDLRVRSA